MIGTIARNQRSSSGGRHRHSRLIVHNITPLSHWFPQVLLNFSFPSSDEPTLSPRSDTIISKLVRTCSLLCLGLNEHCADSLLRQYRPSHQVDPRFQMPSWCSIINFIQPLCPSFPRFGTFFFLCLRKYNVIISIHRQILAWPNTFIYIAFFFCIGRRKICLLSSLQTIHSFIIAKYSLYKLSSGNAQCAEEDSWTLRRHWKYQWK